jgi:SAM-dependent methyltransferase
VWLVYTRPGRWLADRIGRSRGCRIAGWLGDVIPPAASILDVGSGLGHVAEALRGCGHPVVTADPRYRPLRPRDHVRASAVALPFADRTFEVVLLAFTLHHMDPALHAAALAEAARVARRRVVLLEDTFESDLERRRGSVIDSLLNAEFRGHPHGNRTAADWRDRLRAATLIPSLRWERIERWWGLPIRHALVTGEVGPGQGRSL